MRSGYVHLYYGLMQNFGEAGCGWARTVAELNRGYHLWFTATNIDTSRDSNYWGILPRRCRFCIGEVRAGSGGGDRS